jgi:tRNA (adenine57-N1/adenine58-N1)-methyltransferase
MEDEFVLLEEDSGKIYCVQLLNESIKIKGLGILNPSVEFQDLAYGHFKEVCGKQLQRIPPRLPTLIRSMKRRAQTISDKDAGVLIAKLGIGDGDTVVETGLGSGGLSLHLAKVLGRHGTLVTIEARDEHAEVGLENLQRAKQLWPGFPSHNHHSGTVEEVAPRLRQEQLKADAVILDLPNHAPAIHASAGLLKTGGRLACYCPVSNQLEQAWTACEENNLDVEWAGELIDRQWGRASKGGMRPVNGPFGHTAFLLVAVRR